MTSKTLYVTDYGNVELEPGVMETVLDILADNQWRRHGDDLVGLPDIPDHCNAIRTVMEQIAREGW